MQGIHLQTILGGAIIVYTMWIFPYLLGGLFLDSKNDISITANMGTGIMFLFSILYFVYRICISFKMDLLMLTVICLVIISLLTLFVIFVLKRHCLLLLKIGFKRAIDSKYYIKLVFLLIVAISIIATLFCSSNNNGNAAETALVTWKTNSLFVYDPFTGETNIEDPVLEIKSPFVLSYAIAAKIVDQNPVILMKIFFPLWAIPCSFLTIYLLAKKLFLEDMKKITTFLLLYLGIILGGFSGGYSQAELLLTASWEGQSVLINIILPFLLYVCLVLLELLEKPKTNKKKIRIQLLVLLCTCICGKFVDECGLLLSTLTIVIFATIFMTRKWIQHVRDISVD